MPDVVMPQLGETVTEGTVTRWFKSVGDAVARDEPLFEVSTDKVDTEVPSPADGVLSQIVVGEGDTVDVGTVLAVINAAGAQDGAQTEAAAASAPAAAVGDIGAAATGDGEAGGATTTQSAPPAPPPPPSPPPSPAPTEAPPARPAASAPVAEPDGHGAAVRVEPDERDVTAGVLLSPVVRKLLEDNRISASEVPGTGVGERITRSDVLRAIDERQQGARAATGGVRTAPPPPPVPSAPSPPPPPPPASAAAGGVPFAPATGPEHAVSAPQATGRAGQDEVVPFTNIRRRTAEHMVRSKATSAHTLVVKEADYEHVERIRRAHGQAFAAEEGFTLTYLPFVARATAEALREWPNLNASVGEDSLIVHHEVNLGIAVDLDHRGLIVPVISRAEELTLRGMARRIRDLATRARSKRLSADDISGGTFSITNPGPFGTLLTAPIINQPQVAILSTDGVKRRPVVVVDDDGTEAIAVHSMGLLCLSWDHRAVDGAYASAFVSRVAELLAGHDWSAEL